MGEYEDKIDLILRASQLQVRNNRYNYSADHAEKSGILDEQITDILNPKHEEKKTIQDLTRDVLSGETEQ